MMSFLILIIVYAILIALSWSVNYKKKERNLQYWVPMVALLFAIILLFLDFQVPMSVAVFFEEHFPNLLIKGYLLANILLLAIFVGVKTIFRTGLFTFEKLFNKAFFQRIKEKIPEQIKNGLKKEKYIGYKYVQNKWLSDPAFTFPKKAFLYAIYFCIAINVIAIFSATTLEIGVIVSFAPRFPIVSLILFLELYWYLNGNTPSLQKSIIKGQSASVEVRTNYENLYKEYTSTLEDSVLVQRHFSKPDIKESSFSFTKMSNNYNIQNKINQVCNKLINNNVKINEPYCEFLRDILEDKNVLVGDVNYNDISPYLFAAIETLLLTNKKIIVITPGDKKVVTKWIKSNLNEINGLDYFWNIATIDDVIEQNIDYDLMVTNPLDLLNESCLSFIKKQNTTTNVEGVFVLQGEQLLAEYSSPLHIFMNCLRDITEKNPQVAVFSDMYNEVEHHVRTVFNTTPQINHARIPRRNGLFFIAWKKEDGLKCSKKIIPTIHKSSEFQSILALPAIKHGVKKITYLEDSAITTKENLNDIFNNYKHQLSKFGIDLKSRKTILEDIIQSYNHWNLPVENDNLLIINDQHSNMITCLTRNWSVAKEVSFIHVISGPYLLRDYLTANFDYFLENRKAISPLSVRLSSTKSRLAWTLIQRLSLSYLSEETVESYLKQANIRKLSVMEGIKDLFKQTLKVDRRLLNSIDIAYKDVFHYQKMQFVSAKYYSLLLSPNQDTMKKMFSFYSIVSQEGQKLGNILGGHIYQNYLPGQTYSWNGKRFKIEKVDEESQQIDVIYEETKQDNFYKQDKSFIIDGEVTNLSTEESNTSNFSFKFSMMEIPFTVETHGYFSFNDCIDLLGNKTTYVPLNADRRVQTKREYENGNVLKLQVKSYLDPIKNSEKISYTLSFLLNELFRTLYPHTYQYIAVCTSQNLIENTHDEDERNEKLEKLYQNRLMQFIPKMTIPLEETVENSITLYFFEDSPIHVGMIESIKNNWDQIIDVLDDYLYWLLQSDGSNKLDFLKLGASNLYDQFDLQATYDLISKWSSVDNIRKNRLAFYESLSTQDDISQEFTEEFDHDDELEETFEEDKVSQETVVEYRTCDFCSEAFAAAQIFELDDGRERCIHCHTDAVDHVGEYATLYKEVRSMMVEQFGISLREDITIEVKSSKEINEENGKPFTTTENFDPRITGKAILTESGKAKIFLENGATKVQTMATLAHELTHIWQFDHLDIDFIGVEDIEGHATWVEIYLCEMIGEKDYAYRLKEEMEYRDDEYGRGYRQIVEDLQNNPEIFTPFSMFNMKV